MSRAPASTRPEAQINAALEDLWVAAVGTFQERVDALEAHIANLLLGAETPDRSAAQDAAHKLAGTMGMFGMALGSDLARELEELLEGEDQGPAALDRMAEIVNHLRGDIEARSVPELDRRAPSAPAETRGLVSIVGRDSAFLESLVWTVEGRNIEVDRAGAIVSAVSAGSADSDSVQPICAVVIDADSVVDPVAAIAAATAWHTPIIVLAESNDLAGRGYYLAAGASTIVSATTSVDRVADLIERLVLFGASELSMLAIGVDSASATPFVDGFAREGCAVEVLPRESMLGEVIERLDPHTVIVGPDTHELGPLEALQVIAADPVWSARRVILLVADDAAAASAAPAALAFGADDVVAIDHGWEATARRVRTNASRAALRVLPTSSAARSRVRLTAGLESRLSSALASGQQLSILYVHANKLAELNQTDGYEAGDLHLAKVERILACHLRSDDSAGRWAGAGFLAGLGAGRTIALRRLTDALDELTQAGLSCAGAIATAPEDGTTLDALIATATRRALGRPTQAGASSTPGMPKVMVVEDDPVVASLVRELLESEGYGVAIVRDGPSAADALTDPDIFEVIDLVLLDITLPGLDGFGVLRAMEQANTLAHVPVVVLTARVRTEEITAALDLGAVDHVAKPFSPAVLVRRVERALSLARS